MAICAKCGEEFDLDDAKSEYNSHFDGLDYDNDYPDEDICAFCAIELSEDMIRAGIDAMNGD